MIELSEEKTYVTREEHEALKKKFEELERKCAPLVQVQPETKSKFDEVLSAGAPLVTAISHEIRGAKQKTEAEKPKGSDEGST